MGVPKASGLHEIPHSAGTPGHPDVACPLVLWPVLWMVAVLLSVIVCAPAVLLQEMLGS
jgi:hypothetical protein